MFNHPILFFICIVILLAVTGCIVLLIQTFKGKNQTILAQRSTIEELKEIRNAFVAELSEEQLRRKAIASLYELKCEEYDELHALCVRDIFKKKTGKFVTINLEEEKAKLLSKEIEPCIN